MRETDRLFVGSIPELYDCDLGPLIFEPYGRDLAARVGALVRALPASAAIVATDLNQPMLDFAASHTDAANVIWQQADALGLPFGDGIFDAVACQFGAMFFPNKVAAYREAWRVLRPGGRFLLNVWDKIEHNELAHLVTEAVASLFPKDPPLFLARTPHGYHDADTIQGELRAAGFTQVVIETVERRSWVPSPRHPAVGFCQGSPLRMEIEARDPGRLGEATDAAARAVAARFGDGPFDGSMRAHIVVATW
jgi:SAM-dependent methyltransferase